MISVVVTTCNREPQIVERAVYSIVAQTYTNWELIVIDDSPDDFVYRGDIKRRIYAIVKNDIKYISNKANKGACYSRNVGLLEAKGEYIAFLDDDDEWVPDKLEKQINAIENCVDEVALVYGPFYKIDEKNNEKKLVLQESISGMVFKELLEKGNFIGGMSMPLLKTKCVRAIGGFDELMQAAQDMDLWLRIAIRYKVLYLATPLVVYYIHEGEQITKNPQKKIQGLERLNEKYHDIIGGDPYLWWRRHITLIPYYIANQDRKKAFKIWMKCLRKQPWILKTNAIYLLMILRS